MKYHNYSCGDLHCWGLTVILAGLAGGVIEIGWISLYSFLTPISAMEVARQISATIMPFAADLYFAPMLGVCIHLVLAMALAVTFAAIILAPVSRRYGSPGIVLSCLMTLTVVWVINFFVVLPIINPSFTSLMPYLVTLISKLLFGTVMAWLLVIKSPLCEGINTKFNSLVM
jgi:hypothetical protein